MSSIYFYLSLLIDAACSDKYRYLPRQPLQRPVQPAKPQLLFLETYSRPNMPAFPVLREAITLLLFAIQSLRQSARGSLLLALFILLLFHLIAIAGEAFTTLNRRLPPPRPVLPGRRPRRQQARHFSLPLSLFGIALPAYPPPSQSEKEILVSVHDRFLSELEDRYVRIAPRRAPSVIERNELANMSLVQDLVLATRLRLSRLPI